MIVLPWSSAMTYSRRMGLEGLSAHGTSAQRLRRLGDLAVSPPICQALAADALERERGALHVIHAESDARVIAEVEFLHVAEKVLLANVVERADQPALENGE